MAQEWIAAAAAAAAARRAEAEAWRAAIAAAEAKAEAEGNVAPHREAGYKEFVAKGGVLGAFRRAK